jgi:hypothetical protein
MHHATGLTVPSTGQLPALVIVSVFMGSLAGNRRLCQTLGSTNSRQRTVHKRGDGLVAAVKHRQAHHGIPRWRPIEAKACVPRQPTPAVRISAKLA